jgi:hypothetical protein
MLVNAIEKAGVGGLTPILATNNLWCRFNSLAEKTNDPQVTPAADPIHSLVLNIHFLHVASSGK